ncbi:hypothetical protein NONO_c28990 [Nocardia nova SH22a]|uniref:Uncharacterized protein n=1 Tax=Nocardia nova SH22a TaxID=1415166 RepID=W5TF94_9NOCA|nr:hypothetical protein [Nocardia nova]AHH17688.1 hypothetical protein NONO_c28990 [Nocardia nova SH22a]
MSTTDFDTADRFTAATTTGHAVAPVRDLLATTDLPLAYAVLPELTARRIAAARSWCRR